MFLSSDSHIFWSDSLADDPGHPAAIELGTACISSPHHGAPPGAVRQEPNGFALA